MSHNPPKRAAVASFAVSLFSAFMIFIPEFVGIDGFEAGFAISFFCIFIAIATAMVGFMYLGLAKKLDAILSGEGVLAHWTYSTEYWVDYAEKEYEEEKSEKKGLFFLVSGFAILFGVLFWLFDTEAGFIVFIAMLGLIGLVGFVWRFSPWYNYRKNIGGVKEAYITKDAVYLNNKLYSWSEAFSSFDEVTQKSNQNLSLLLFKYTTSSRTGPQSNTIRVPIPMGQEEVTKNIILQINSKK